MNNAVPCFFTIAAAFVSTFPPKCLVNSMDSSHYLTLMVIPYLQQAVILPLNLWHHASSFSAYTKTWLSSYTLFHTLECVLENSWRNCNNPMLCIILAFLLMEMDLKSSTIPSASLLVGWIPFCLSQQHWEILNDNK